VISLSQETADDFFEVEALYDLCFGVGRKALSSYRLRDGVSPVAQLSLLARDGEIVTGAIRYWPVRIDDAKALLLGPVAVHPTHQGEGLGGYLICESLKLAQLAGWERVMLIGDAPYYARFGFTLLANVQMPPPTDQARILGRDLQKGAWGGVSGQVCLWQD
jgi:predicted N-acetyltransferase YhbS